MLARHLTLMIIGASIPSVASCTPMDTAKKDKMAEAPKSEPAAQESIGTATAEADGTIVLQLRATAPGGDVGDGILRYPPNHPNYAEVKAHVGPIPPGKSVPVKPFD